MVNLEKKIKQAYIDGSNSNNKLIQFYLEQIKGLEAQLKAKENDLERQDMIIKCLNIDLDSKEKLLKAKDEEIAMFKKHASSLSGYHEFIEQLETFDFDTFGKDDCFDNGDVYQVLQFFAHKIYGVLGKQIEAKDDEIKKIKSEHGYEKCKKCTHYSCGTQPDSLVWEKCGWDWKCKSFFEDHFELETKT